MPGINRQRGSKTAEMELPLLQLLEISTSDRCLVFLSVAYLPDLHHLTTNANQKGNLITSQSQASRIFRHLL